MGAVSDQVWRRLDAMVGEWRARLGDTEGGFTMERILGGRALLRRNQLKLPAFTHEDVILLYRDGARVRGLYVDTEAHVIDYDVAVWKTGVELTSTGDTRYRLRHRPLDAEHARITFEIAERGSEFAPHVEGDVVRVARESSDPDGLRRRMIDTIVKSGFLRTPRIEAAFRAVPRHVFLPDVPLERVYSGEAIPTHHDARRLPTSSSSEPGVMAVMLEQLRPAPGQRWLEIGAGTGYNAALLAWLVRPDGSVTTLDIQDDVAREARERLAAGGFADVRVVTVDGWRGHPEGAPYDRIELTASVDDLSPFWVEQLAPAGRLLVPLFLTRAQALVCFRKDGERLVSESVQGGGFMALRGEGAWTPTWGAGVVVTGGTWSASLAPDVDVPVRSLGGLLGQEARVADPLPLGYAAFALLELAATPSDGVPLVIVERGRGDGGSAPLFGLLDLQAPALAAGNDQRLLAFGPPGVEERLRRLVARSAAERWSIVAVPAGHASDDARVVLRRRHYDFVIASTR